ncbi:MAG: hypothetical protein QME60_07990 [Verrucomicrobiota bacterium]|nr:hypothetical protein [Verrucomicrobiota bacterium]
MKKPDQFDFWYAVNHTEVVLMPSCQLETFGSTILHYHLLSELMDQIDQVRVREGRMLATKPEIITPAAYSQVLLEGFGEQAGRYAEWLREHETEIRILQYGYRLKQESFSEHVISDKMKAVVDRVKKSVKERADPSGAVVIGVDEPWDVCLIKLFREVIVRSAHRNIMELASRKMFEDAGGVPRGVRDEIEETFQAAVQDPARIPALAKKLEHYQLFAEYQDRFFSLVKTKKT